MDGSADNNANAARAAAIGAGHRAIRQQVPWHAAATLGLVASVCAATVNVVEGWLRPQADSARIAFEEARLEPVLQALAPPHLRTREPSAPVRALTPPGLHVESVDLVRAADEPVGLLLRTTIEQGYAGPIRLAIGMTTDGILAGVQVLEHAETPGLGDRIEAEKSDWLSTFKGRSLASPDRAYWAIARDGGAFDQMTGASITSRAVVRALRDTLIYVAEFGLAQHAAIEARAARTRRAVDHPGGSSDAASGRTTTPTPTPAGHGWAAGSAARVCAI